MKNFVHNIFTFFDTVKMTSIFIEKNSLIHNSAKRSSIEIFSEHFKYLRLIIHF